VKQGKKESLTEHGSAGALNPASQKTASRKLYEILLRRYCPTSEVRSLSEAIDSRKFLAVLLSPESLFATFWAAPKSRSRRDSDIKEC
jgi:hypothetical protein